MTESYLGDLPARVAECFPVEGDIAHIEALPARKARFAELRAALHPKLDERRRQLGIEQFFGHQCHAIEAALAGKDVMLVTGTNSGKSLAYLAPILQSCLTEPNAKALLMFPTKALAQDQHGKLEAWTAGLGIRPAVYDGDTPARQRSTIRRLANLVVTNPDMLHIGILPGHENWAKFFHSLRFLVIDEAHVYRGIFGSHVAWIVRRLLRLAEMYGSRPQIIACSGTVGNPAELFGKLAGREPTVVAEDDSPRGRKAFVFVNPQPEEDGTAPSRNLAVAKAIAKLAEDGARSMAFCRSRVGVELVGKYAREIAEANGVPATSIESYRAGYTPQERREIEQRMFQGDLLAIATTNAMELGVDIGGLDVVVMNGYPGTIASFWQQAGRAGRGERPSAVAFIAGEDPLEQYLAANPATLLASESEPIALNPDNRTIAQDQLLCMAHERPIAASELAAIGEPALAAAEALDGSGQLEFRNGRFYYPSFEAPAPNVNIRGIGGETVTLLCDGREIGTMEHWRALQNAHAGAVYLHRGESYLVQALDLESRTALLERFQSPYYTQSIVQSVVEPLYVLQSRDVGSGTASLASMRITSDVIGFRQKTLDGGRVLGVFDLDLPPSTYETIGIRLDLPSMAEEDDPARSIAGVHGSEHALLAIAPLFAGSDRNDLGSAWYAVQPDTLRPALFLYDACPGGIGLAERLFVDLDKLLRSGLQLLHMCPCAMGCPRCLYSSRCEVANDLLDKDAAMAMLRSLLNA